MIFAGFTFAPIPNWDVVIPVKAPSNYKKQDAIDKYVKERKEELAGGAAAIHELSGTVAEITVIPEDDGKPTTVKTPNKIAGFFKDAVEMTSHGCAIVGCRIHRAMKLLAIMNAVAGKDLGNVVPVGHFGWINEAYNKPGGFIDPISLLFGSSDIDVTSAGIRLGVSVNPDSSAAMAEFARIAMRNVDLGA